MQIITKDEYTKYTIIQNYKEAQTKHKAGGTVSGSGMLGDMFGKRQNVFTFWWNWWTQYISYRCKKLGTRSFFKTRNRCFVVTW